MMVETLSGALWQWGGISSHSDVGDEASINVLYKYSSKSSRKGPWGWVLNSFPYLSVHGGCSLRIGPVGLNSTQVPIFIGLGQD